VPTATKAAGAGAAAAAAAAAVAAATSACRNNNAGVAPTEAADKQEKLEKEQAGPAASPPALIADLGGTLGGDGQGAAPSGGAADGDSPSGPGTTGGQEVQKVTEIVPTTAVQLMIEPEATDAATAAAEVSATARPRPPELGAAVHADQQAERHASGSSSPARAEGSQEAGRLSAQDVEALCAENQRLKEEVERQRQQIEVLNRMNQVPGSSSRGASPGKSAPPAEANVASKPLPASLATSDMSALDISGEGETILQGISSAVSDVDQPQAGLVGGPPSAPVSPGKTTKGLAESKKEKKEPSIVVRAPRMSSDGTTPRMTSDGAALTPSVPGNTPKASSAMNAGLLFANTGTLTPMAVAPTNRAGAHSVPVPSRFVHASPALQDTFTSAGGYPAYVIRPPTATTGQHTPRGPAEYAERRAERSLSPVTTPRARMMSPFVGPTRSSGFPATVLAGGIGSTAVVQAIPMSARFVAATPAQEAAAAGSLSPRLVRPLYSFRAATPLSGALTPSPGLPTVSTEMPRPSLDVQKPVIQL